MTQKKIIKTYFKKNMTYYDKLKELFVVSLKKSEIMCYDKNRKLNDAEYFYRLFDFYQ